jgi:acetolactate synthase-1/2/3 large subunit
MVLRMPSVAELVVRRLCQAGVTTLFGVPGGGGNLDLVAAAGRAGLRFVLTGTETGAVVAAVAQTEVTGRPGACLTTLGPGAASAANGVACARLERAPVLVFTDSYATRAGDRFPHQRLDHAALFAPIVKATLSLEPDAADRIVCDALSIATSGIPGPVHVECPADAFTGAAEAAVAVERETRSERAFPSAGSARARQSPRCFSASRPVILAGLGARTAEAAVAIRRLSGMHRIPVMVTYKAKGVVADDDPWFAGVFTNAAIERPLLERADLLLGIGLDPVELIPRPWTFLAPVVYAGPWPVEDAQVPFEEAIIQDAAAAAGRFETALSRSTWTPEDVQSALAAQRREIVSKTAGFTAQVAIGTLADVLAPLGRVTVDAGAHMFPATMLWPVREPGGMLISNGLSTMGFAVPAAIGASLADERRPVVALTGDGGLLMCAGDLATIGRERLRVIVVVFADDSLSLIEIKQRVRRLPASGVALGRIDWQMLARGFGLEARSAATAEELADAARAAVDGSGPWLIEARIDRTAYGAILRAVRG